MQLRAYQYEAVQAVYRYLREHDDNPCVVIPTAGGKSLVLAQIARDAALLWQGRVLILAHVRELLEQNADKLRRLAPDLPIGLYSAGLGCRDTLAPVIVAGIQSAYRRAADLGRFDLVVVDEVHLVPPDGEGMYRTLLADLKQINPALRVIGFTATPFRMTTGPICAPENILNAICYEVGVRELIVQGYLCPLRTKAGREKVDTSELHVRAGEFIAGEVETLMDQERLVAAACQEIVEQTRERHTVLVFASGVQHAQHVAEMLRGLGQSVATVFGDTPDIERDRIIADFKSGQLKYLVNVNVLTTGFDAPNVDCVAMLRPTLSPGLWVQCCGRAFRLHPSKKDALILDFGGNAVRHGPVDAVRVKPRGSSDSQEAPARECPACHAVVACGYSLCPECGHEFPRRAAKHDPWAGDAAILSGEVSLTSHRVDSVHYTVHIKRDSTPDTPRSMRVEYKIGWQQYQSEWVCFEHTGYARRKAELWWRRRSHAPIPSTAAEAVDLAEAGALCETRGITIRSVSGEEYSRIVDYELGPVPAWDEAEAVLAGPEPDYVPADDSVPF